jgi:hypothetical protein
MTTTGIIISFVCIGWIAGCYYFLFRRSNSKTTGAGLRSERDVISFIGDASTQSPDLPVSFSEFAETNLTDLAHAPIIEANTTILMNDHNQINDNELIDIRTLSLNISNQN